MADNRIAYGLAKKHGIDTAGMSPKEVWKALKEKGVTLGKDREADKERLVKKYGISEVDSSTIKSKSFVLNDRESLATYDKITKGGGYSIEQLQSLPVFNRIQEDAEKSRYAQAKRLGMPDEYNGYTFRIRTPEREKAREQWVSNFLVGSGVNTRPSMPLKKDYKLTVIVGLPASGKSTTIANPLSEEQGAFIFDSDEIKKLIDGFDSGKNADGVHRESKDLLMRATTAFISGKMKGTNIVFPIIGDKAGKTMRKLQPFIDAGYEVEIAYKKADTRESMNRVISRAIKDGRYIPRNTVMEYSNENIEKAYDELLKLGIKRSKYSER